MQIFLFFALFISILAIIFAVQNNDTTTVSFLFWETDGSVALILLISIAVGALISFLASLPTNIKYRLEIRNLRKQLSALESEVRSNKVEFEGKESQPAVEKNTDQDEVKDPTEA